MLSHIKTEHEKYRSIQLKNNKGKSSVRRHQKIVISLNIETKGIKIKINEEANVAKIKACEILG